MKALFSSSSAILTGLLVLDLSLISAESFTEGVRVSPETVSLKPGQYVWEPERAPEGPLLIVASITEQVAYVYRNGIRIARSSVSTGRPGHPTPTGAFTILEKEVHHTSRIYKGHRCLTWSASHGAASRYTLAICRDIPIPMDVSGFRLNFRSSSSASQ